jgi:hypothetical protein
MVPGRRSHKRKVRSSHAHLPVRSTPQNMRGNFTIWLDVTWIRSGPLLTPTGYSSMLIMTQQDGDSSGLRRLPTAIPCMKTLKLFVLRDVSNLKACMPCVQGAPGPARKASNDNLTANYQEGKAQIEGVVIFSCCCQSENCRTNT